jgi:hypothetical protein
MTYFRAVLATVIYVIVLLITYYVHIAYFTVNVVLYAAVIDAFIALGLTVGLMLLTRLWAPLSGLEKSQLLLIWLLGGYGFAISVPTVMDRSLSFYILEKLQQRGGGIELSRMPDVFIDEYMTEYRLVDIRLTEQEESGTIVIEDGCVKLTPKGERLASFGQFFRQHLLPKKRLLRGEYTDVLTKPFENSIETPDYTCR